MAEGGRGRSSSRKLTFTWEGKGSSRREREQDGREEEQDSQDGESKQGQISHYAGVADVRHKPFARSGEHAPLPVSTDGEAANPGPHTLVVSNCSSLQTQLQAVLALDADIIVLSEHRLTAANQRLFDGFLLKSGYVVAWGAPCKRRRFGGEGQTWWRGGAGEKAPHRQSSDP